MAMVILQKPPLMLTFANRSFQPPRESSQNLHYLVLKDAVCLARFEIPVVAIPSTEICQTFLQLLGAHTAKF